MHMSKAVNEIYSNRHGFIVIGLTGRTGSGCSTVALALSRQFDQLMVSNIDLTHGGENQKRKLKIVQEYAKLNWKPFKVIHVRDIISSFILENSFRTISSYFKEKIKVGPSVGKLKEEYSYYHNKNKCMAKIFGGERAGYDIEQVYNYFYNELPVFTNRLKEYFNVDTKDEFLSAFQRIGNNIRKYGNVIEGGSVDAKNIYSIAKRINYVVKSTKQYNKLMDEKDFFVIDAFRNPLEVKFFQERYSAFYLMAINCNEEDRFDRLFNNNVKRDKIREVDERESKPRDLLKSYDNFLSQDVATCIQLADIYITNPGKYKPEEDNFLDLNDQLVRYISLIQHPGLITPSRHEKLMQIAFTAKLSSGCISRQVGAVVTNSAGSPKAIGWNSSPEEQTPCLLRNVDYLLKRIDQKSYSKYEKENKKLKTIAVDYQKRLNDIRPTGLSSYYCFKSFQNKLEDEKNQVHTRALHAEENAFLQIAKYGGEGIKGGLLYTTASPCELCAKKAYQLGIKEIVYIEPYPGISFDHILNIGDEHNIPRVTLFSGAIGSAYHKLYLPIIPIKDEVGAYLADELDAPCSIPLRLNRETVQKIESLAKSNNESIELYLAKMIQAQIESN